METESLRAQVIERVKTRQAEWDALLAEIPPERMEKPGVESEWSVKDMALHLAHYENWLIVFLESVLHNRPFEGSHLDQLDLEARNAFIFEANRPLSLAEAFAEVRKTRARLFRALDALTEEDFEANSRFAQPMAENPPPWDKNISSLEKLIAGETYLHYEDHMKAMKRWLDKS